MIPLSFRTPNSWNSRGNPRFTDEMRCGFSNSTQIREENPKLFKNDLGLKWTIQG